MICSKLHRQQNGNVLQLTLDDAASRNSIGPEIYGELTEAILSAGVDAEIGAIMLSGANGYFCSGGNILGLKESATATEAQNVARMDGLNSLVQAIANCPVPVIAAVEGGAAGAGLGLMLACDMVVAEDDARFIAAYVKIGLTPDAGVSYYLGRALPRQLASEILMLGKPIGAARFLQLGLVNQLSSREKVQEDALELALRLASGPASATAGIKGLLNAAGDRSLADQLGLEARSINRARRDAEAAEGLAAFLEKRQPVFNQG